MLALVVPSLAFAQAGAPNATAGQALFDAAVEEMAKKSFATACPKLEEVTRLVPDAVGAKAQLAECYEGWGRSASAWSQWTLVETLARNLGQADRQALATTRVAALRPKLAMVTVRVASAAALPDLAVVRDGSPVGRAQWSTPVPIDAGEHHIEAAAPGHEPWKHRFEVSGDGVSVVIDVPTLARTPASPPPTTTATAGGSGWQEPVGLVALGVGGAAVGVGAIFGIVALGTNADSNDGPCDAETNACNAAGVALREDALGQATLSTVLLVAGGAVATGGLVLWVSAPSGPTEPAGSEAREASPRAGLRSIRIDPTGLSAEGRF